MRSQNKRKADLIHLLNFFALRCTSGIKSSVWAQTLQPVHILEFDTGEYITASVLYFSIYSELCCSAYE